jgi:heme-degrading monooxygenase HmoA
MVEIVWEFQVTTGKEAEFERHYRPEGTWVQLFRRSPAFIRTELLRDCEASGRYLTIDCWGDLASYDEFRAKFAAEYKRIDARMESLTQSETKLGVFEAVGS